MPRFQDKKYIRFGWPGSEMCGAVGCLLWWEVSAVQWDVWDVHCGGIAVGCAELWYVRCSWMGGMLVAVGSECSEVMLQCCGMCSAMVRVVR